jgi:(1->4)-alpha-D-glucan 1-alpha-D-glucosylmutase
MKNNPLSPRIPGATYRLQFNSGFTFRDATRIIGYLHDLGITDIYSSPFLKAKRGSLHGYDIVDPQVLNPEIGTNEDYAAMAGQLRLYGMGQVLDIVPNHMAVDSAENRWWMDVLENGPSSPAAEYFDIDWEPVKKELRNKVLLPILGDQYGNILEGQELAVEYHEGAFQVRYYDHVFPVRPQTYVMLLEHRMQDLRSRLKEEGPELAEYLSIVTALKHLPSYLETDAERIAERHREKEVTKRRLAMLAAACPEVNEHIGENIRLFNGAKGDPKSFDLLDELMNQQIYRLSHWRVATEEINYRRFFDINGLGAIRVERPAVFAATHDLIFRLISEGSVTGLRVDHPDGLYNPVEYFHRLQRACFAAQHRVRTTDPGNTRSSEEQVREFAARYDEAVMADPSYHPFYIVGEKILTKSERMPEDWPIFSTTGYVFVNSVNGIFVDGDHAKTFDAIYEKFIKARVSVQDVIYEKKKLVMLVSMSSEVNTLGHYLNDLSEKNRLTRDFTLNSLTGAIVEAIAAFPVYRTYINTWAVNDRDRQVIELAVSRSKRKNPAISTSIFDFLKDVLLLRFPREFSDADKTEWLDLVMRFQQITGPVMAKGVEDTAFYVYNRLVSLNEVGGMPERFGTPLETFHGQNIERMKSWPHAMIATATHDTKRSADVRARINVLSEMPDEWSERVRTWARINKKKKGVIEGSEAPDRNEEYLLYQTLIGVWPLGQGKDGAAGNAAERVRDYMIKAAREAKVNTSWINPNEAYEQAMTTFIERILMPRPDNAFLQDFLSFHRMIAHYGMYNSLSQVLLKICSPGVPDFYQGTELWDLSLVDPDNRRSVDHDLRRDLLAELKDRESKGTAVELAWELSLNKEDGRIMLYLVYKALNYRKANRDLFMNGEYLPLNAEGAHAGSLCAFARRTARGMIIAAAPRFLTKVISGGASVPFGKAVWEDTRLLLPEENAGVKFKNVFTQEIISTVDLGGNYGLLCADIYSCFPVVLLERIS